MTAASVSGNTISFVGIGFPTSGYSASGTFKSTQGQGVVHDSTSADVTFPGGIPIAATSSVPTLVFTSTADGTQLLAYSDATAVALTNPLSVRGSTASLACSFAGGCQYAVQASGLTASLLADDQSYIDFCGNHCALDADQSNDSQTVCTLDPLVTAYSVRTYKLAEAGVLQGTWEGSAGEGELAKLSDGINTVDLSDSTAQGCYF